jgi:hypothetical protein
MANPRIPELGPQRGWIMRVERRVMAAGVLCYMCIPDKGWGEHGPFTDYELCPFIVVHV